MFNLYKSQKKVYCTLALLSLIISVFLLTRNAQTWSHGYTENVVNSNLLAAQNISVQLSEDIQSRIETMVLFIGYPRSGHTLIGSLLDAHPHIIVSNELDIFETWSSVWSDAEKTRENLINKMYENSYRQSNGEGFRSATKHNGRNYAVPHQWQGKYKNYIKVIGDKKGGKTTRFFSTRPKVTQEVLSKLNLPLRLVHMVRNPYDNIATMLLRQLKMRTSDALAAKNKTNNTLALARNMRLYTWAAYSNRELIRFYGSRALTLYSEDVINDPQKVLKKLCTFLDVVCTEDYLKDCASIIYRNPSKTRTTIAWTPKLKQDVENVIKSISFLNRYTFDS